VTVGRRCHGHGLGHGRPSSVRLRRVGRLSLSHPRPQRSPPTSRFHLPTHAPRPPPPPMSLQTYARTPPTRLQGLGLPASQLVKGGKAATWRESGGGWKLWSTSVAHLEAAPAPGLALPGSMWLQRPRDICHRRYLTRSCFRISVVRCGHPLPPRRVWTGTLETYSGTFQLQVCCGPRGTSPTNR
jgi:hypothetical protein